MMSRLEGLNAGAVGNPRVARYSTIDADPCLSAEWAALDARETYRAAVATWDDAFADYYAEALVSGALSRKADALYVAKAAAWAAVEAASDTMHRTREEAADARC
ncbi:MAG: hypothetical protein ABI119_03285 [Gemmatimonadaceae bacterium]